LLGLLAVGAGGCLGALARYGLSTWAVRVWGGRFPVGTLVVNVLGCFLLGALMAALAERQLLAPEARLFLTIGFLGSFTTFSTVGYETFDLLRAQDVALAAASLGANVAVGMLAVALGWWLGTRVLGGAL